MKLEKAEKKQLDRLERDKTRGRLCILSKEAEMTIRNSWLFRK